MRILVGLMYFILFFFYKMFYVQYDILTRVLTPISILLLFFIVNSICSVTVNIKERINKIKINKLNINQFVEKVNDSQFADLIK